MWCPSATISGQLHIPFYWHLYPQHYQVPKIHTRFNMPGPSGKRMLTSLEVLVQWWTWQTHKHYPQVRHFHVQGSTNKFHQRQCWHTILGKATIWRCKSNLQLMRRKGLLSCSSTIQQDEHRRLWPGANFRTFCSSLPQGHPVSSLNGKWSWAKLTQQQKHVPQDGKTLIHSTSVYYHSPLAAKLPWLFSWYPQTRTSACHPV